ncbi:hypothetical protein ILUMI_04436 [Ignelater luminosus]|uniref:Cystinosin homolog n=1 Tax=Ignelater luminosus TaxID=2038154 RepID=A0A8K0DEH7_IGNLU|nr:hypothetical protein ILUMI_04436 [Ignelater luminosus]
MYLLHTRRKGLLFAATFFSIFVSTKCDIQVSTHDLSLKLQEVGHFKVNLVNYNKPDFTLNLIVQHDDIIKLVPPSVKFSPSNRAYEIAVEATSAGHSEITANVTGTNATINVNDIYLRVTVYKNKALDTLSVIIGWTYFVAWSVSFYPQIYINYRRKSVIGLNFDFLSLNVVGFILYSVFNVGLYAIPEIEAQYFKKYPRGLNPVQLNDVVFGVHATVATVLTITQCFLYERGDQRVSFTAKGILGIFAAFLSISLILVATNVLFWLDFLYFCSYVKLAITLIKYIPQAYMNYRRKSTVGWSIGNILLDFTGGILSMLQMIIISHNYDDWVSIFGDPTKFGLGLFSVIFDIFFMIQHYILYRHSNYEEN